MNTTLADIIKHMTPDRAFEDYYPQLQSVVSKILAHMHDFSLLFSLVSMTPDRVFEDYYPQLQSVVSKILAHMHDFSLLFSLVGMIMNNIAID